MTLTKEKNITPTKKNHDNDLKISKLPLLHLEKCSSILIAISLLFSWNSKEMSQMIKKHNHKINKTTLFTNCYVMTNCDNIVGGFAKNDFPLMLVLYNFITLHNSIKHVLDFPSNSEMHHFRIRTIWMNHPVCNVNDFLHIYGGHSTHMVICVLLCVLCTIDPRWDPSPMKLDPSICSRVSLLYTITNKEGLEDGSRWWW